MKEKRELLAKAALERLDAPCVHQEFICPNCGGVATVIQREVIEAECHACGLKVWKRTN